MVIKTKLTEKDFVNVNLVLLYKKWVMRLLTAFGLLALLIYIAGFFVNGLMDRSLSSLIFPAMVLVGLPALTAYQAKRNYQTNLRISETITYNFSDDFLEISGDSFTSKLSWEKFYKVTETKNWILIWQNSRVANVLPKRDVWEGEQHQLKELLTRHNVKSNLK